MVVVIAVLVSLAVAGIVGLSVYSISREDAFLSPSELSKCELIEGGKGSVNIVFFSEGVDTKEYVRLFSDVEPFKSNKEKFNFFLVPGLVPDCELYKGEALFCYSKELFEAASSCPNDYIVVLKKMPPEVRSSSFANVLSLNAKQPKSVILHEFGHAFGNLAEEYVFENPRLPRGSKNCRQECDFGTGFKCYPGCSDAAYLRSYENGIMRSLDSERYGPFDEFLISEKIPSSGAGITGRAVEDYRSCASKEYYLLELVDGKVKKSLHRGCAGTSGNGGSSYEVFDRSGKKVFEGNLNKDLLFTTSYDSNGKTSGEVYEVKREIFLKVPVRDRKKTKEGGLADFVPEVEVGPIVPIENERRVFEQNASSENKSKAVDSGTTELEAVPPQGYGGQNNSTDVLEVAEEPFLPEDSELPTILFEEFPKTILNGVLFILREDGLFLALTGKAVEEKDGKLYEEKNRIKIYI